LIRSRPIGMFRMTDEKGGDDKFLCVPAGDPGQEHQRDLHDVPEFERLEIEHFLIYKELEPGQERRGRVLGRPRRRRGGGGGGGMAAPAAGDAGPVSNRRPGYIQP
jgi:hypothetical protein